jgi:hypothetical protein
MPRTSTPKPHHVWVTRIGRLWVFGLEFVMVILLFVGAGCLTVFGIFKIEALAWVGLSLVALYIALIFVSQFAFYHLVKCPHCGYNPTRVKATGRKMHGRIAAARLRDLENCPECGK